MPIAARCQGSSSSRAAARALRLTASLRTLPDVSSPGSAHHLQGSQDGPRCASCLFVALLLVVAVVLLLLVIGMIAAAGQIALAAALFASLASAAPGQLRLGTSRPSSSV